MFTNACFVILISMASIFKGLKNQLRFAFNLCEQVKSITCIFQYPFKGVLQVVLNS